ncbi:MAG: 2-oxo acid dehydrogenase subunit E2 [Atribacterota bacterium]|nr:2-oxo acid dehydrogenase subunit E2 [Atribacterota bacterium]
MESELKKIRLNPLRKAMIRNFNWSNHVAAQSTVSIEINMANLLNVKEDLNQIFLKDFQPKLTFLPLLMYMIAKTLSRHPYLNAELDSENNHILYHSDVNIGFAVAIQRRNMSGILLPVIQQADQKNLKEIALLVSDLSEKAIQGTIKPDEMQGGTFSVSSVGGYKVDFIQPLLNYPQGAILGVTRIKDKPVVESGKILIAPIANFIITVDHRIIDGVPTYEFLADLKGSIEKIEKKDISL